MKTFCTIVLCVIATICFSQNNQPEFSVSQTEDISKPNIQQFPLNSMERVEPNGLTVNKTNYKGFECLEAFYDKPEPDEIFVTILGVEFGEGSIEIELSGFPGKYANKDSKGFVGLTFHVQNDTTYECIYLRPVNSIDNNQLFRNRTVQYTSHPNYPWQRQRKESPGVYETYCDVKPGEWINFRIEVKGNYAKLYINNTKEPSFIVSDLKLGADVKGGIGLWVGSYTHARFRNLKVTHLN